MNFEEMLEQIGKVAPSHLRELIASFGLIGDELEYTKSTVDSSGWDGYQKEVYEGEKRNTNQTLPRIAFQLYESEISALAVEEREQFPICQYTPEKEMICGIFISKEDAKKHNINAFNTMTYEYGDGRKFVMYSWNIFSTIRFVQECLKRFGNPGDSFKLLYREKDEKEEAVASEATAEIEKTEFNGYLNPYSTMLVDSKNIIFRGAPGTGKTYLVKEIATDIISNGYFDDYMSLLKV